MTGSDPDTGEWAAKAADEIARHTPSAGHNVVAVDSYETESPLYLVSSHADLGDAESARAAHEMKTGDRSYVYSAANSDDARAPAEKDATTEASFGVDL